MTVHALLLAARTRIADEAHWTQGTYARNAMGKEVSPYSPSASCWCLTGALMCEAHPSRDERAFWYARDRLSEIGGHSLSYLNDTFTHAEVLALLDDAIDAESHA